MKVFFIIILLLSLVGCYDPNPNMIYHGPDWVIEKLNDSTLLCIPVQGDLLGRKNNSPYLINLKTFKNSEFNQ